MNATTTPAAAAPTYSSLRAAALPLLALCLAFFVEMVDNTLLSIALPTIGRDLGGSTTALQWVTGAYSLTFGGLLLTAGSAADRFGRRRVLLTGLAAFGLISLAVVLVSSSGELIALRAALGLAAAAMAPVTMSLIFRLFTDEKLRMRAITVVMIVGMSGFVLGPVLGGTALAHVSWQWLLVVNAPIALIAWIGVRFGVPADRRADLTSGRLDLPGTALSILAIGLGCYTLTAGVEYGWLSLVTIGCAVGTVLAVVGFIWRERTAAAPMLDLNLFVTGPARGAAITQMASSIAMASVMFALVLHFQYAYGWSPMLAGLANLPMIATMLLATPISEKLAARFGHRIACLIATGLLVVGLLGLAWGVDRGYLAIAVFMVVLTVGLRTIMTICAVALVAAMPANRTSMGAALNDTSQEVGTSVGTAVVGTLIAALVTTQLPAGVWNPALVQTYFGGERITFLVLAVAVGLIGAFGSLSLTNSHATDEHEQPAEDLESVPAWGPARLPEAVGGEGDLGLRAQATTVRAVGVDRLRGHGDLGVAAAATGHRGRRGHPDGTLGQPVDLDEADQGAVRARRGRARPVRVRAGAGRANGVRPGVEPNRLRGAGFAGADPQPQRGDLCGDGPLDGDSDARRGADQRTGAFRRAAAGHYRREDRESGEGAHVTSLKSHLESQR